MDESCNLGTRVTTRTAALGLIEQHGNMNQIRILAAVLTLGHVIGGVPELLISLSARIAIRGAKHAMVPGLMTANRATHTDSTQTIRAAIRLAATATSASRTRIAAQASCAQTMHA